MSFDLYLQRCRQKLLIEDLHHDHVSSQRVAEPGILPDSHLPPISLIQYDLYPRWHRLRSHKNQSRGSSTTSAKLQGYPDGDRHSNIECTLEPLSMVARVIGHRPPGALFDGRNQPEAGGQLVRHETSTLTDAGKPLTSSAPQWQLFSVVLGTWSLSVANREAEGPSLRRTKFLPFPSPGRSGNPPHAGRNGELRASDLPHRRFCDFPFPKPLRSQLPIQRYGILTSQKNSPRRRASEVHPSLTEHHKRATNPLSFSRLPPQGSMQPILMVVKSVATEWEYCFVRPPLPPSRRSCPLAHSEPSTLPHPVRKIAKVRADSGLLVTSERLGDLLKRQ